jgi:hypothetical protein
MGCFDFCEANWGWQSIAYHYFLVMYKVCRHGDSKEQNFEG